MNPAEARPREGNQTRSAILQAATQLFATQGFAATGLQQVADAAGVARATPSYFFGSKEGLWKAVLEAQNQLAARIVPVAFAQAGAQPDRAALIGALVDATLGFHEQHPEFLRLIQWSELQGNGLIHEVPTHGQAVETAVHAVQHVLRGSAMQEEDVRHVVLSVLGACYAHLVYGRTLGLTLGLHTDVPAFLTERRAHLKRLLLATLGS
ncbi:TetR/AcrR family transcriptional regulator [Deinococcus hopiensis]|uniref:Transcriptional regulator, TetR family n=1 Tax=Deinococcus hopiensis KR-140 TaxID=695939 RepID=A0A1W1V839_9DEIO|nr:TetR/AcrR family transcriptional regulator [Deinococcus hopiensis]SMB89589.1 transcriptional regulator, TetR family [Deinococcus hopiensis KR-140]